MDTQRWAIPLSEVVEVLRPLPVSPFPGAPPWLSGLALLRGYPTPVVDPVTMMRAERSPELALSEAPRPAPTRFVALRSGARRFVLAVDAVLGVRPLPAGAPLPLLLDERPGLFSSVDAHQARVLYVLSVTRLIPEATWALLEGP